MQNDCVGPNLGRNKDNNYNSDKCGAFGSAVICNCMYGNEEENGVIDNVEGCVSCLLTYIFLVIKIFISQFIIDIAPTSHDLTPSPLF